MVRGEPVKDGDYHLVVHVCVFSSEGKMLIQQRQSFEEIKSMIAEEKFVPYHPAFIDMLFHFRTNTGTFTKF